MPDKQTTNTYCERECITFAFDELSRVKVYDKLIRDEIPTLMTEAGVEFEIEVVEDVEELKTLLERKLVEESLELKNATSVEDKLQEYFDLRLVLAKYEDILKETIGWDTFKVAKDANFEKCMTNGVFEKNIKLKHVVGSSTNS